jgi:hypothetical protein
MNVFQQHLTGLGFDSRIFYTLKLIELSTSSTKHTKARFIKSQFVPKGLFCGEKLPSLNISYMAFSSNIERQNVGPTQPPVQWVPRVSFPGE